MNTRHKKPCPYRVFRSAGAQRVTVLQILDPEHFEPTSLHELDGYKARTSIRTPWFKVGIPAGSVLFLSRSAARFMVQAGTVERIDEPVLVNSREVTPVEEGTPTLPGGDQPGRKPAAAAILADGANGR